MSQDDPIARLAKQIDASRKAERLLVNEQNVAELRRRGAGELHEICAAFVLSVNRSLSLSPVELSPPAFTAQMFRDSDVNLIRIGAQGRELQIAFQSTAQSFSTEKFLVPYVLEGEVRTFNQKMLDRFEIRNQSLFYCVNENSSGWRFYDWRYARSAPLDPELLATLMEPLFR